MAIRALQETAPVVGEMMRWSEVIEMTGMSQSAIQRAQRAKPMPFPARRMIPGGGKKFRRSEIQRWLDRLPQVQTDRLAE
jgi:predicted DNA-binding transcriptional regulator AlpA